MPTYQYVCVHHHNEIVGELEYEVMNVREGPPVQAPLCSLGHEMKRDWRGEAVGFAGVAEIKREREGRMADRGDILPTAKDFERPEDPTGEKGMQRWMDNHSPRHDNKNPAWPTRSERTGV